jgi:diguanylate cyclase (GGDEF)-like protein
MIGQATASGGHRAQDDLQDVVAPGYWPRALGLRVIIAASYFVLIPAGLLPMSTTWWLVSGGGLLLYSILVFGYYLRQPNDLALHKDITPFSDAAFVTLAIVALARLDQPIWIGYMLIITSLSTFHSTRYLLLFSLCIIVMLWTAAIVLDATGRQELPWRLTIVVSIMAVFTAINCDTITTSHRKLRNMVREAALTDPLTGLDNRRRFRQVLDSHDLPEARPLAVLMYDVDNFKQINEERGHVAADVVLVQVAQELKASFRDADTIARYGGDELIVLAHVATLADAIAMGERSLEQIEAQVGITLSAGVSVYPVTAPTLEAAVRQADDALGRAKHTGKARVVSAAA